MKDFNHKTLVTLDVDTPIWDHIFTIAPLVIVGTKEGNEYDLAPKHMATPIGFDNFFGFVCTPNHSTYTNIKKYKEFVVSFPMPDQVVLSSLSASPRCDSISKSKQIIESLPTMKAPNMEALFISNSYLYLECELFKIIDGFNLNSIITGKITAAFVDRNYLKQSEVDEQDQIHDFPLLAYIALGRFATVKETYNFPFPKNFKR